ncbi:MAG: phytoene/squalene synthase family protein [Pirellulaceae bacterium]
MNVAASYRECARLARRSASSFYWSFWLLPRHKRLAMCALYAFSRRADDLADSDKSLEERSGDLANWRRSFERAQQGEFDDPLLPAIVDTLERFEIPPRRLSAILDGVEMDLEPRRFETFGELREYCLLVASAVGMACLHIWGFEGDVESEAALDCGVAFQLTNILRDLREDARRGRVYLPQEDMRRFGYREEDLLSGQCNEAFQQLMSFEIERTETLYQNTAPLYTSLPADGRRVLGMMSSTYWRLLQEIKQRRSDVLQERVSLSLTAKLGIAASHIVQPNPGTPAFLRRSAAVDHSDD